MVNECSVEGCKLESSARGWCKKHYSCWYRTGSLVLKGKIIKSLEEKLMENYMPIPESGCWIWTACVDERGYGYVRSNGRMMRTHRASWLIHNGQIPKGLCVLHKCEVPSCINPNHLFLGTQQDNIKDMDNKGRRKSLKGESNHKAKLTESDIREIRKSTDNNKNDSKKYGVLPWAISKVKNRDSWKHIK